MIWNTISSILITWLFNSVVSLICWVPFHSLQTYSDKRVEVIVEAPQSAYFFFLFNKPHLHIFTISHEMKPLKLLNTSHLSFYFPSLADARRIPLNRTVIHVSPLPSAEKTKLSPRHKMWLEIRMGGAIVRFLKFKVKN